MSGVQFKAVGKSLDDLAKTCRALPKGVPSTIAYANSGLLQQAGRVVADKYVVPGKHADKTRNGYLQYTSPPGATHGTLGYTSFRTNGRKKQPLLRATERKLFVKGKFVSRTGELEAFAKDLSRINPFGHSEVDYVVGESTHKRSSGQMSASIMPNGNGALTLSGGYRAAEVGQRGTISNGVKGWWRGLRTASSRWSTLMRKKYPELMRLG